MTNEDVTGKLYGAGLREYWVQTYEEGVIRVLADKAEVVDGTVLFAVDNGLGTIRTVATFRPATWKWLVMLNEMPRRQEA